VVTLSGFMRRTTCRPRWSLRAVGWRGTPAPDSSLTGKHQNRHLSSLRVSSAAIYGSSGRRSMAVSTPVACPIPAVCSATWLDSFAASTSSGGTPPSSAMNAAGASTHGSAPTNGVEGGAPSEPGLLIARSRRNDRSVLASDRGATPTVSGFGSVAADLEPSC